MFSGQCRPWRSLAGLVRHRPLQGARRFPSRTGTNAYRFGIPLHAQARCYFAETALAVLKPPAIFTGLLVTLWAYKCLMMVLFQNKIIYMPSVPPFSRSEQIADYKASCSPFEWSEHIIQSSDGTRLILCVAESDMSTCGQPKPTINILYFQGNGASMPPRLPMLTSVLRDFRGQDAPFTVRIIALSYRGYWKSSGRPSESGIRRDAQATLQWSTQHYPGASKTILWGQSLGAAVAAELAASSSGIDGLIMETPFLSIKAMLVSLYPQKWLPYRYLWPFLWNTWDNSSALERLAAQKQPPRVLMTTAENDEVVPQEQGKELHGVAQRLGLRPERLTAPRALHHEVMSRREGREGVRKFLCRVAGGE